MDEGTAMEIGYQMGPGIQWRSNTAAYLTLHFLFLSLIFLTLCLLLSVSFFQQMSHIFLVLCDTISCFFSPHHFFRFFFSKIFFFYRFGEPQHIFHDLFLILFHFSSIHSIFQILLPKLTFFAFQIIFILLSDQRISR